MFEKLLTQPLPFFLDGGMDAGRLGRYSFMGCDPFITLTSSGGQTQILHGKKKQTLYSNPFDILACHLDQYKLSEGGPVPFCGGAVGYLSYDLCHCLEALPGNAARDVSLPDYMFGFYDMIIACDNLTGKAWLLSTGLPEVDASHAPQRARHRLEYIRDILSSEVNYPPADSSVKPHNTVIKSNFTPEKYFAAVRAARNYIIEGDIFEVNISQRFEAEATASAFDLYRHLRSINPAPFAAYMDFGQFQIVSASPERFISLVNGRAETRPIKGTRPRGKTAAEDCQLSSELLASEKDRAENIMIVDLARNDLGRVCAYGSVTVEELAILEKYATVFHLTSTVAGQLAPGKTGIDLIKACFPGGSITGAPKIRAMQIIDELEPTARGVYTGSIGYLGFNGNLDLNIAIRTMVVKDGHVYFQAGGAITYDSNPEDEYQETLHKARALIDTVNGRWQ